MKPMYALLRAAALLGRSRRLARRAAFDSAGIRRIWIHKPDHLGDAVLARPALALVGHSFPQAEIRVACHPAAAPLLMTEDRRIVPVPWSSPFLQGTGSLLTYRHQARAFAPDLVVNLRHDVRDILLCAMLGAPYLVTYDHRGLGAWATHAGPPPSPEVPEAENHVRLLSVTLGLAPVSLPPLHLPEEAIAKAQQAWGELKGNGLKIALHAVARTPAKLWPAAFWRDLSAALRDQRQARLAFLGEETDRSLNQQIVHERPDLADWSGRFTLDMTAAVIAQADLLIGIDSGPGHLAKAVGTPVISIMSGTNPTRRWAPDPAHALVQPVPCAPCQRETCHVAGHPCLHEIRPDRVLAEVAKVLDR